MSAKEALGNENESNAEHNLKMHYKELFERLEEFFCSLPNILLSHYCEQLC